jgi:deoxyribonuclease IV
MIRFGPAGLGSVKDSLDTLEKYNELGIRACEIAFTYGVYIKNKEDALRIKRKANELGIKLSIHAQYWINLNSEEKEKIENSMKRILQCCEVANWLGAEVVVFHPGFYGKKAKEKTYENIKEKIIQLQEEIKKRNWKVKLAPETTGKKNVFGSIDEIARLVTDTGCYFCIDFAHILARYKNYNFKKVFSKFKGDLHIHFSGIEYGEKGEKRHKKTSEKNWKELLMNVPKNREITIINESPLPVEDSILGIEILKNCQYK